ncbi:hypothetical protein BU15DRAFT_82541 [Melanogaster broomeanus]|nr:hypothetical protein BU15DRAFT_82541 [Melanogaster broomeanus]
MSSSFKPPNIFYNDSDDEDLYVPSRVDNGKRKADDPWDDDAVSRPWPNLNHNQASTAGPTHTYSDQDSISVDFDESQGGFLSDDDDSQSTASARLPTHASPRSDGTGSDSDESFYESLDADVPLTPASDDRMDVDMPVPQHHHDELDLSYSIKGMYRILDLISEQGSGGLVDKIIISQNSIEAFINSVCPGAYVSMTKVNFKALDKYIIKPVGVYGSKEEIVRFLSELGVVDDAIAAQLLVDTDTPGPTRPTLRSGLYIISAMEQIGNSRQTFLLYWPEQATWDDSAASSDRRNRVTFMRYLTKMCDQVIALISSEHAQTIVWNENDEDNDDTLVDQDESDRMFTFEVAQTNEQEESVTVREGFKAVSDRIAVPADPADGSTSPDSIKPSLLFGETAQGFMTVKHQDARLVSEPLKARTFTPLQLEGYLVSDCLRLSESLDDEALKILARSGLEKRFPQECGHWNTSLLQSKAYPNHAQRKKRSLHEAILDEVQRLYPCLDRRSFPYIADPGERDVENPEPLSKLVFPLSEGITDNEFRAVKHRICFMKELYPLVKQLDKQKRDRILRAALAGEKDRVKDLMKASTRSLTGSRGASLNPLTWLTTGGDADGAHVDGLIRDAIAGGVSDH